MINQYQVGVNRPKSKTEADLHQPDWIWPIYTNLIVTIVVA